MFDLIRTRIAAVLLLAVASLGFASCDSLAALTQADNPTHRFVIEADLERIAEMTGAEADLDAIMQESMDVITRRVEGAGGHTQSITYQGDGVVVLETSGLEGGADLVELIGSTGELDFRMVDHTAPYADVIEGIAPPGSEVLPMAEGDYASPLAVRRLGGISGATITSAVPGLDSMTDQPVISITFNERGAAQLAELTRNNVGQQMAIVLDDLILSAPVIQEPIFGGSLQLAGGFTVEGADRLAVMLNSGALPAPFTLAEENVIPAPE